MRHPDFKANTASTPKNGLFATLDVLLHRKESCAPSHIMLLATVVTIAATVLGLTATLPAVASAYATVEGPPIYSSAPGLPDGRVYEQVSPANKNGNQAGSGTEENRDLPGAKRYGVAAADGNSVLFEATGPIGETASAFTELFVATKNASGAGWNTRSVTPAPPQPTGEIGGEVDAGSEYADPSADLSHALVEAGNYTLAPLPNEHCDGQIFLTGPDPFVAAQWLEQPETTDSVEICSQDEGANGAPVGGSPNFSTVYFTYPGTLLPEDARRAPHAGPNAWGFYEVSEGTLREAGILPDGSLDQFGAVPAASGHGRALTGNQIADEGKRAFFVSPDPASCEQYGGHNNCTIDPPELYVRENGSTVVLVSRDVLLADVGGLPASAPGGVFKMTNPTSNLANAGPSGSYVFASSDGSQAFFQSTDALTKPANEASPGAEPKTYDFDVDTGVLTYLPDVVGQIVATDEDGSSLAFVQPEAGSFPAQLDRWSTGPNGGSVTPVTQLSGAAGVSVARMSTDGSVIVFTTSAQIAGFNNGGTHPNEEDEENAAQLAGSEQIYRYNAPTNILGCVSCPPRGVTPTGDAAMSWQQHSEERYETGNYGEIDDRGISADGSRVFFDTPDPLVPQDTNTGSPPQLYNEGGLEQQGRDVYEWENGVVYLISGGKSARNSYFLDNSESGNDVFFATTEGLVVGDTDNGYDVYDARVPRPGDNPPPAAVPCEGAACQGPPRVPSPLASPASATFSGLGSPAPEPNAAPPPPKKITTTVKCSKGKKLSHKKCVKVKRKNKKTNAKKASNDQTVGR